MFLIQINDSNFSISASLAIAIQESSLKYKAKNENNKQTFIFANSDFLQNISSNSTTHFYISIQNKKFRIKKEFYNYFKLNSSFTNSESSKNGVKSHNKKERTHLA
jgi:hypothetical protein